jgi:alpha-tubulin suppressor-like RCC1 family protein
MNTRQTIVLVSSLLTFGQILQAAPPAGYVIEWGWNTPAGKAAPARQVLGDAIAVSAGRLHCLALKSDGTVVRWAGNPVVDDFFANEVLTTDDGSGGGKPYTTYAKKIITNGVVRINGQVLGDIVSVAAGDGFSLALKKDGTLVTWGENYVPAGLTNIKAIAAAWGDNWVLKQNGTVVGWNSQPSNPQYGQLLSAENLSNVVAIAVGSGPNSTRNVALKSDGTVVRWGGGETIYNDQTPPTSLSNVVTIAAGSSHTLALKNDGTVIGWGFNDVGQATGIPTTNAPNISAGQVTIEGQILNNVASIAAGHGYSMALKRDGTIVTWGRMVNDLYPATVPAGLSNVVAIAAGDNFCLAITTDSAVAAKFRR